MAPAVARLLLGSSCSGTHAASGKPLALWLRVHHFWLLSQSIALSSSPSPSPLQCLPSLCPLTTSSWEERRREGSCGEQQVFEQGSRALGTSLQPWVASPWDITGWQCAMWDSTDWCTAVWPALELPTAPTLLPAGVGDAPVPWLRSPCSFAHQALGILQCPGEGTVSEALVKRQMLAPLLPSTQHLPEGPPAAWVCWVLVRFPACK